MSKIYKDSELIGYTCDGKNCNAFIDLDSSKSRKCAWIQSINSSSISIDHTKGITTFRKPLFLYFCLVCATLKGF